MSTAPAGPARRTGLVVEDLAGGSVGLHEATGPVFLVEAEGGGIAADDAFVEDAAGKLAETILLQRQQMVLADLGDGRDVFERNAAIDALLAQVFPEIAHSTPLRAWHLSLVTNTSYLYYSK